MKYYFESSARDVISEIYSAMSELSDLLLDFADEIDTMDSDPEEMDEDYYEECLNNQNCCDEAYDLLLSATTVLEEMFGILE